MKSKVYIAAPYTKGDVAMNVRSVIEAADELVRLGFAPYLPHLTHFWHLVSPHPIEFWYANDNEWLPMCDALLRLPGESHGADDEITLAQKLGIPVFYSIDNLVHEMGNQG